MAGHSKWSQIKHKKAKTDAKRGQAFTKLLKEITVSARTGGGDPAGNAHLRLLLEKAKEINMPQENTVRAIKKGTGELPGVSYQERRYEGYGPDGIAVVVDALTDNTNRTVAELRRVFSTKGGTLGEAGSVSWMFEHMGVVRVIPGSMTEDELFEQLLEFEVHNIRGDQELTSVFCDAKALDLVRKALVAAGLKIESAALEWVPKSSMSIPDDALDKALDFLSTLQDHEDVQNVYTNLA